MRNKIAQLLNSKNTEDVRIAAELLGSLEWNEILDLLQSSLKTRQKFDDTEAVYTLNGINLYEVYKYGENILFFGNYQLHVNPDRYDWPINIVR